MSTFNISDNEFHSATSFGDGSRARSVHHGAPLDPATVEAFTRAVADLRTLLDREPVDRRDPTVLEDLAVIDGELERSDPVEAVVRSRIASLADRVAPAGVLLDAVARIGEVATRLWPQ